MISTETHPADSTDFLSRLHDGDLEPGESAAFESHRAGCAACRASVAAFERALSAYRDAPVPPVASDLSARILRKIRATSPSRRPFGVTFGIDVRWAGVLAAALLVLIIGAPVFSRHPFGQRPAVAVAPASSVSEAIPAHLVDAAEEPRAADRAAPVAPAPADRHAAPKSAAASAPAAPPQESSIRQEPDFAAAPPVAARTDTMTQPDTSANLAKAEPESDADSRSAGKLAKENAPSLRARRPTSLAEPSGGEAGLAAAVQAPVGVRLEVRAIDNEGTAPALVATPSDARLSPFRGREFVLTVESDGRVGSVESRVRTEARKDEAAAAPAAPPASEDPFAVLRELVFQPGVGPRRLTVTVR